MTLSITSKIVGFNIKKKTDEVVEQTPVSIPDVNPLHTRIESRPEGTLQAVSEKISYSTQEGRKKVYILVSFSPVNGVIEGKDVTVERPIEFFFPIGQIGSEHQWITATMRNLSLAARGGYVTQALQDLRKVTWDKGPVRCGTNTYGKPLYHDSEVAAIAWSIQQILYKRGFLDVDGNQVPAKVLARRLHNRVHPDAPIGWIDDEVEAVDEFFSPEMAEKAEEAAKKSDGLSSLDKNHVGVCPECQEGLVLIDGCPTCVEGCGYSKCQ